MNSTDPKRLSSLENVPELTDALAAARERLPDSNTLEALRTRLEAAVEAPIDAPVATPFKSWPVALKIIVPLLGVAGAVIAAPRFARYSAAPLPSVATPVSSISAPVRCRSAGMIERLSMSVGKTNDSAFVPLPVSAS